MKKNWKRVIALVCSICMLAVTVWTGMPENTVEASEGAATEVITEHTDITTADIPEGYKWLTASDFHSFGTSMAGTQSAELSNLYHDINSTLDKTVFTAKVNFPSSGENRIYLGKQWGGISFWGSGDNINMYKDSGTKVTTFTPDVAGCKLTGNVDLEFTVSFEFVNNDGTNTDVKVGVFFKENLYNDAYVTVKSVAVAGLMQRAHLYISGCSLTIADAKMPVPTYLTDYTTTSIGLSKGVKNITNTIGNDSVDGTIFGTKVTFTNQNQWLQYGGTGSWYGVRFQMTSDGRLQAGASNGDFKNASLANQTIYFEPTIALGEAYTSFSGVPVNLHISTEVIKHNDDESLDVRYGVFFNGKLYNNQYIYSYNTASMVGNYVGFQNQIPSYTAAAAISKEAVRTDLEQLSTDDITATYGTSWGSTSTAYTYALHPSYARYGKYEAASNFDGKTFGANVTLSHNSGQTFFQVGGSDEWSTGIRFKANGVNLVIESGGVTSTTVTPDFIGEDTFNGTPITIWVSTEVANLDGGDAENDVKYTIYIDGKIYTVLYAMNYASSLSNGVVFTNWDGGSTFSAAEKTTTPITTPEDKTSISFSDFEIANGKYENVLGKMGTYTGEFEEILGTVFTGYVTYSSTHSSVGETRKHAGLYFLGAEGGADSLYGMRLANEYEYINVPEGGLSLSFWTKGQPLFLTPELAGVDLLDNEFKLSIEVIAADFDGDEDATDVLVGIYINDKLYNNTYFNVKDALVSDRLGPSTRIYTTGSYLSVASVIDETFPTDMLTLTADEMGIAGQWNCASNSGVKYGELSSNYTSNSSTGEAMSLVGKTIDMDIQYTGANYIHFAAPDQGSWNGVRLQTGDGFVKIESSLTGAGACESVTCTPTIAGVDFTKEFNLKLTFALIEGTNDVNVGVWFNNKLYNHKYLLWKEVADKLNISANIIPWDGGSITIADPKRSVPTAAEGYTCKTLNDYGFVIDQTYLGDSVQKSISGLNTEKLVVSGKVALTGKGHLVLVGNWLGYYLGIDWTTNSVYLSHTNGIFGKSIKAPLTDVANGQFAFDLVQTFVDADYDGNADDVQLELWIDGKLVDGRSHYYMDYADQAKSDSTRVFPDGGTVVVVNNLYYEYKDGYYFNLAHGEYLVMAPTVNINNAEATYEIGDKIATPGDYRITRTDAASTVTNEVYLWKAGDANSDNAVNIKDIIAAKKVAAGLVTSKSAIKAADVDNDGKADADILRKYVVGTVTNLNSVAVNAVYYTLAEDGTPVMPISGFWGPRTLSSYTDTTELNTIQAKYYELIADMGINVINYIEVNSAGGEANLTQNLQNLSLAEKYNIGLFVLDSAVNGELTEAELVERLSLYGKYGSFLGIHTYDEPCSDNYNANSGHKKISEIAAEATKLNSYTNLSSYINLYPLAENTIIKKYLNEYLTTCAPKYLTYDYYPSFTSSDNHGYFEGLALARTAGIPFWTYVSAGGNFTTDAITSDNTMPSRSQLLWNVNTALAYGAKGIQYFPMIQPNYYSVESKDDAGNITAQDFDRNGLIAADGSTTKWYDYAKAANAWIATVDGILMNAESEAVITCGTTAQLNTQIYNNKYAGNDGATVSGGNAIVGVFTYEEKTAYYVVNYNFNGANDTVATNDITLTFDADKTMTVYNTTSSGAVAASTTNKALTLTVEYGGAALVIVE